MGFADYFLIGLGLQAALAKTNGIGVGPGRGSAAGSIVAYRFEITDIDPIKYDLLFERFDPHRKSMPDIDIDFVYGRDRVINYVSDKYGRDQVAQIITGMMMARAAVRDAGRVLDIPYGTVDKVAKLIPEGLKVYLDDSARPGSELKQAYDADEIVRQIVDLAKPLEGLVRQDSIHARRRDRRPAADRVPAAPAEGRRPGGRDAVRHGGRGGARAPEDGLPRPAQPRRDRQGGRAGRRHRHRQDPARRLEDVRDARARKSTGVFQFESSGMRDALKLVKPTEFEDLIALVALYRPGPMGYIPIYGKRKHGGEQVTFLDDRLRPITEPTYGICIYQEQYMEIAKQLAGFSPAEADDLRKAIGKKIHKLMASLKDKFLEGCAANGVTPGSPRSSGRTWSRRRTTPSTSRTPPATG